MAYLGLDAVLIMDGAIRHQASAQRFSTWLEGCGTLPMVLINSDLPQYQSVNVENSRAFRSLLEHLHQVHGYTRMVFMAGPVKNGDAAERLRAFREFEIEHQIGPAPVIACNFLYQAAFDGLSGYLAEHPLPQVVVCANDTMAFGAIGALRDRGCAVPQECAVSGFDNVPFAALEFPPLTTVDLPSASLGREAYRLLENQITDETVLPKAIGLETGLVLRESCACPSQGSPAMPETLRREFHSREKRQGFLLDLVYALGLVMESTELSAVLDRVLQQIDARSFRLLAIPLGSGQVFPTQILELHAWSNANRTQRGRGLIESAELGSMFDNLRQDGADHYPLCIHGIISGGEVLGLACFQAAPEDRHVLEIFIQNLAGPLMRLRQREEQQRLASQLEAKVRERTLNLLAASAEVLHISEAERRRIGSELHDDICQQLAATLMQIKILQGHAQAGNLHASELGLLRNQVEDTLQTVRGFSRGLFPAELETLGLPEAIERLAERLRTQTGIAIVCRVEALQDYGLDSESALNLFRIIQEGMQNVIRHAKASSVGILANKMATGMRVELHDNGQGFAVGSPEGLGMRSMRYRALQLSARLEIHSSSEGTGVILDLPGPGQE